MIECSLKPLTPPQIAKHSGIKADKVLTWIRSGELRRSTWPRSWADGHCGG